MARPIVLSNGELHVGLNNFGLVHDFYFPYVGLENHAAAKSLRHRIGVYIDGTFSWFDDGSWQFTFSYPFDALIGKTIAHHKDLGVILEFEDAVDAKKNIFLRNIQVINAHDKQRDIKIFMHQVFAIGDAAGNGDTVQYLPDDDVILHYKGRRVFTIAGTYKDGRSFTDYSVGLFGIEHHEGTFKDAEDGQLAGNVVEHGRVDSVIGFTCTIKAHDSDRLHYWITADTELEAALVNDRTVRSEGVLHRILLTDRWWHEWLERAQPFLQSLDARYQKDATASLLLIKSHIDKRGAIMASTDTTMLNYLRDAYAYCWPRDGAYVIWPLIRLGYKEEALHFFNFCRQGLHSKGYLLHKYQADGALGSSWHPYTHNGQTVPPIQEDETAIVLFMFAQYYMLHQDHSVLQDYYSSMVKPMATFLASYIDPQTHLPKPSYDLWEEVFLVSTYTVAVTYAALLQAADLAILMNDQKEAERWKKVADEMAEASPKLLFNSETGCFNKGLKVNHDGALVAVPTIDSASVFGVSMFGLCANDSFEIQSSLQALLKAFNVTTRHPGVPRYENDTYLRTSVNSVGNPWFVTTLWLAQYYLEIGLSDAALELLHWSQQHMTTTGVLPEQINPKNGAFLSVAPLMWSQAEFLNTLLDMKLYASD